MKILPIQTTKASQIKNLNLHNSTFYRSEKVSNNYTEQVIPSVGFKYNANINFRSSDPNRLVADMEFENYKYATPYTKRRYRKLYQGFAANKYIDKSQLFDQKENYLPLMSEDKMDKFLEIASIYKKYKDQPIICLGRSPKWFLNTALWMKDGIPSYTFVAFSKYWYRPHPEEGMVKLPMMAPTEKEELAYRKYLRRQKSDPKTIVDHFNETGKKTVITDYIYSGKGASSFLEMMGNYAKEQGILEEFSKAIQIVGIGSTDYMEEMNPYADTYSEPRVPMPEVLAPYERNIKQEFYNMDYIVFREMLLNQNTNECRSTYYPHNAWTVYKPDQFKTGMVKDMKKVQNLLKELKGEKKYVTSFTAAMQDYRNLLNFRILDALDARKILKEAHVSKL